MTLKRFEGTINTTETRRSTPKHQVAVLSHEDMLALIARLRCPVMIGTAKAWRDGVRRGETCAEI